MNPLKSWRIRKPETDNESVYISEKFGVRTLHIGSDTVQSSMRLARPNDLEVSYTRSMMAYLLFNPAPRDVLMIGLGGGSVAKFTYHNLPQTRSVAVEVNPDVVAIARQFFLVPPDDERLQVIVGDGAAYLGENRRRADVIMVDGYGAESQAPALATSRFYRDCARALGSTGILVVNLWGGDRDYTACVERIAIAFDDRVACLPAGRPGNVVVMGFSQSPGQPGWQQLRERAQALEIALGLEFTKFVQELAVMNPHDADRLLL